MLRATTPFLRLHGIRPRYCQSCAQSYRRPQSIASICLSPINPFSAVHIFTHVCFSSISAPRFRFLPTTFPDCEKSRSTLVADAGSPRTSLATRQRGLGLGVRDIEVGVLHSLVRPCVVGVVNDRLFAHLGKLDINLGLDRLVQSHDPILDGVVARNVNVRVAKRQQGLKTFVIDSGALAGLWKQSSAAYGRRRLSENSWEVPQESLCLKLTDPVSERPVPSSLLRRPSCSCWSSHTCRHRRLR